METCELQPILVDRFDWMSAAHSPAPWRRSRASRENMSALRFWIFLPVLLRFIAVCLVIAALASPDWIELNVRSDNNGYVQQVHFEFSPSKICARGTFPSIEHERCAIFHDLESDEELEEFCEGFADNIVDTESSLKRARSYAIAGVVMGVFSIIFSIAWKNRMMRRKQAPRMGLLLIPLTIVPVVMYTMASSAIGGSAVFDIDTTQVPPRANAAVNWYYAKGVGAYTEEPSTLLVTACVMCGIAAVVQCMVVRRMYREWRRQQHEAQQLLGQGFHGGASSAPAANTHYQHIPNNEAYYPQKPQPTAPGATMPPDGFTAPPQYPTAYPPQYPSQQQHQYPPQQQHYQHQQQQHGGPM